MGLLAEIKAEFGANGLYELFGVAPKCTPAELKRAYLDAARKYHPDKAQGDLPAATRKFQILSRAHALLSEPEARKIYDESGDVNDESTAHHTFDEWTVYFRRLFPKVSSSMINSFVSKYQGSEEEKNDVKAAYLKHKGDMNALFDEVMASNPLEDEDRFRQMIGGWIADGSVPAFPAYVNEKPAALKKRMDKAKKEAAEAEEELHEHRAQEARSNTDSLQALILARQKERDSMWERFEAKHTNKAKKRAQRDNVPLETLEQPSEEDFLATQARLEARRKQATSKAKKEEEDDEEDENETAEAVSRPRKLSKKAGASTKKGAAAKPAKAANAAKQTAKSPARGR